MFAIRISRSMKRRRRRQRHRRRRPRLPFLPPPPPEGTSAVNIGKWLGYCGEILVLFETASGFALFCYDGTQFFLPKAVEKIWADFAMDHVAKRKVMLREFQTFEDKASAINLDTGRVSDQLARMLKKWLLRKQMLAVGKLEYKTCIEASLGIPCLFNDAVMETMWGLNNLVKSLVPEETKENRLPMSKGLMICLERNGFADVEPEMVNNRIIEMAYGLYECDLCENQRAKSLHDAINIIKEVSSDIDFDDWDSLKRASAVKMICFPKDKDTSDSKLFSKLFSDDELSKLSALAPDLEGKFYENTCLQMYKDILLARGVRLDTQRMLKSLIKEARESCIAEGEQAGEARESCTTEGEQATTEGEQAGEVRESCTIEGEQAEEARESCTVEAEQADFHEKTSVSVPERV